MKKVMVSEHGDCQHTFLHGVELEHRAGWPLKQQRRNEIGPDLWECDNCLTIRVEDTVGILDADGKDIRAQLAEAKRLLHGVLESENDTHHLSDDRWTVFRQQARAFLEAPR